MIQHAPKKEAAAAKRRPHSEDELLQEGLEESFPASDPPSAARPHHLPNHPRPVWDQYPETD